MERLRHPGSSKASPARLTKASLTPAQLSTPVPRQQPAPYIKVKRGMRPIAHADHQAMPHRIEMDVVDMSLEISVIPNRVLPETTLPQRRLSIRVAHDRCARLDDCIGKSPFDE